MIKEHRSVREDDAAINEHNKHLLEDFPSAEVDTGTTSDSATGDNKITTNPDSDAGAATGEAGGVPEEPWCSGATMCNGAATSRTQDQW